MSMHDNDRADLEAWVVQSIGPSVKASCYDNHLSDAFLPGTQHCLIKPCCASIYVVCGSWGAMFGMLCDMLKWHNMFCSEILILKHK